jgi:hypothetical protein
MPGPFASNERFEIAIKYIEKKLPSGLTKVITIGEKDEETQERYKDQIKIIHTQWSMMNWKETNDLIRQATYFDAMAGRRELDWVMYRQLMLESCMKSWDITQPNSDGKGESGVPCTKENISRLDPNIATALVQEFVDKTSMSDNDLGN